MIGTITVDLDKVDYLLRKDDCPVSLGVRLDTVGKERLLMMFVSVDYTEEAKAFAESLIARHKAKYELPTLNEMQTRIDQFLGKNGFVFMNEDQIPYFATRRENEIWLFSWSEAKKWVPVKQLQLYDPAAFDEFVKIVGFGRYTDRAAEEYHAQNRFNTPLENE